MNIKLTGHFLFLHERYKKVFSRIQRAEERKTAELGDYNAFLQWEKEYIKKRDIPSAIDMFVMIKSKHCFKYTEVYNLASRYGVPYATIKNWVESEAIKTEVVPAYSSKIDSNTGEIFPILRLFVSKEHIIRLEETEDFFKKLKESAEDRNNDLYHDREHAYSEVAKSLFSGVEKDYGSVDDFFIAVISALGRDETETEDANNEQYIKLLLSTIEELEKKLSAETPKLNEDKGLSGLVCKLRREGKSDEEIAAYLYDGGTWCTQAQIGALLHADDSRVASESMQQRARRLLGKA